MLHTENEAIRNSAHFEQEYLNGDNDDDLESQLKHNLAALFFRMHTILSISENAMQDVIQQINQIMDLSEPLIFSVVQKILLKYYPGADTSIAREIVCAV